MSTTIHGRPRQLTDEQRERMRAQNREWHRKNLQRSKERHRAWVAANKDRVRKKTLEWQLWNRYGLTPDQYRALGWTCFICGAVAGKSGRRLHIDHDHETGTVRGLLCSPCNTALGSLREDPRLFRRALAYLARFGQEEVA